MKRRHPKLLSLERQHHTSHYRLPREKEPDCSKFSIAPINQRVAIALELLALGFQILAGYEL